MLLQLLGIEGSQPRQLPSLPTPQPFQQQRQHSSLKKSCTCCPHNQHSLLISGAASASVGGVSAADGAHFQHEAAQTEAVLFRCGSAIPQSVGDPSGVSLAGTATSMICRDKITHTHTKPLSRQTRVWRDKTFVATKNLSRQKSCLWQLPPMILGRIMSCLPRGQRQLPHKTQALGQRSDKVSSGGDAHVQKLESAS